MIISHKYKFLFIGLPFSASSAISKELYLEYDGEAYLRKHSLNIEIRDARGNKAHRNELKEVGGKIQVPCLRIEKNNNEIEWLYESKDIVNYLDNFIKS